MSDYVLTPRANRDITQIWLRVARDSFTTADEVESTIIENCELLGQLSGAGHTRRDLTHKQILVWTIPEYGSTYQIIYDLHLDHVRILRVVHGVRRRVWKRGF
jgi:plasmid stabilization system protein ParE